MILLLITYEQSIKTFLKEQSNMELMLYSDLKIQITGVVSM